MSNSDESARLLRLVIGVGNDYRNDDAVGLVVARRMRELSITGLTVIEASGEATGLLEAWQDARNVILVDAVASGAEPGTIHRFDVHAQAMPARLFHSLTHAFGVAVAIELARALNRLPPHLIVYGIEGKDFSAGTTLSQEVAAAAKRTVERVIDEKGV